MKVELGDFEWMIEYHTALKKSNRGTILFIGLTH